MPGRSDAEQKRLGEAMRRLDIEMGVFVAEGNFGEETFVKRDPAMTARLEAKMTKAVEIAKRCGARWMTVVPGRYGLSDSWDFQTANVIENLKRCAAILEPHDLVMVLEPLNRRDHSGLFLTEIPQAFMICEAVGSPSCKILNDLYHQQITEGNLIPYMDQAWSEIAYFQVGDNPGRREPTTGEIDYRNVFRHLHRRGFKGIVGMEHGLSLGGKDGVDRLIEAYRECDRIPVMSIEIVRVVAMLVAVIGPGVVRPGGIRRRVRRSRGRSPGGDGHARHHPGLRAGRSDGLRGHSRRLRANGRDRGCAE